MMRALLTEAGEARRDGDHSAAVAAETDALRIARASAAEGRQAVQS